METIRPEELFMSIEDGGLEYFVDGNGVYWYDYEKLMNMLFVTSSQITKMYKHLSDHNKNMLNVLNRINSLCEQKRFITTEAVCDIINKQNQRANGILLKILNNESSQVIDYKDYNTELDNLVHMIDNKNHVGVCQSIQKITKTKMFKDTMDKCDMTYNKELEDTLDVIRDEIFDYMYDENDSRYNECIEHLDRDLKQVMYKKHKKLKTESTCPSWLRELV